MKLINRVSLISSWEGKMSLKKKNVRPSYLSIFKSAAHKHTHTHTTLFAERLKYLHKDAKKIVILTTVFCFHVSIEFYSLFSLKVSITFTY